MMEENFRRIADAVRLPEGSRARIRTQIASHRKEQEASTVKQPKKHLPRLAVAAIIIAAALPLPAAAAAWSLAPIGTMVSAAMTEPAAWPPA